jgi:hypothetical protein
MICNKSKI